MLDLSQIPLFSLADSKLAWIDRRQQVLAQDVANADTPGWRSRDLTPFAAQFGRLGVALARTDGAHLAGTVAPAATAGVVQAGERAPDGNGVALDRVLMRVADTDTAHELTTGLEQAWFGMFRTVIGK